MPGVTDVDEEAEDEDEDADAVVVDEVEEEAAAEELLLLLYEDEAALLEDVADELELELELEAELEALLEALDELEVVVRVDEDVGEDDAELTELDEDVEDGAADDELELALDPQVVRFWNAVQVAPSAPLLWKKTPGAPDAVMSKYVFWYCDESRV